MTDKERLNVAIRALAWADTILFDTYSNAQKLKWEEVEENCLIGCKATKDALDKIGYVRGGKEVF